MPLLVDANLSPRILPYIIGLIPGSLHVFSCGKIAQDDQLIWDYAKLNGFTIIMKDRDFFHMSTLRRHPPKVVWLKARNASTAALGQTIRSRITDIQQFEADTAAALLIIDL